MSASTPVPSVEEWWAQNMARKRSNRNGDFGCKLESSTNPEARCRSYGITEGRGVCQSHQGCCGNYDTTRKHGGNPELDLQP